MKRRFTQRFTPRFERCTSMVQNPNPKGEGSNRSSALPQILKKIVVESPNSELPGEVPLGSSRRKNFSK